MVLMFACLITVEIVTVSAVVFVIFRDSIVVDDAKSFFYSFNESFLKNQVENRLIGVFVSYKASFFMFVFFIHVGIDAASGDVFINFVAFG
jgi:hypothetical protein